MVKLFGIAVYNQAGGAGCTAGEPSKLKSHYDLSSFSFFQRGSVEEFITFASKTIVTRTPKATRQSIKQDVYMCHVYVRADGLAGVLIADHEYPQRVAHTLISKVLDDFAARVPNELWTAAPAAIQFETLPAYLAKYQDPREGDKLTKMQDDLQETEIILRNTIEAVMQRGEKLDDLVQKSEELSFQSKAFYRTAKKTNSCCSFS